MSAPAPAATQPAAASTAPAAAATPAAAPAAAPAPAANDSKAPVKPSITEPLDAKNFVAPVKTQSTKIITKIMKSIEEKRPFYSFEYFPPKTPEGVKNLYSRIDRMSTLDPMFMDVTWGAGGSTAELTLDISANAQNFTASEVMMHLTCTNMVPAKVKEALDTAKKAGIRNILALRGDPPKGAAEWEMVEGGFAHAVDLVKYIKREYADYFGIAVAGYPEAHMSAPSLDEDLKYLKEKVDAGADFVITQLFYDCDLFLAFVQKARAIGIKVPIIPGIMPIQNYNGFKRMTSFCKTAVPKHILDALEPIKHDDARVKQYGIELGASMCRKLLDAGVPGLHFYTLNLERSVVCILEALGYVVLTKPQNLPWKKVSKIQTAKRQKEDVRPIFWANRPKSYLYRTSAWDDFPNGRWGDARSPAFGDLSDYHLCSFKTGSAVDRKQIWGTPTVPKHIFDVFEKYIEGEVKRLPWCESPVQLETVPLKNQLKKVNKFGFLTINSQPRVNGADSADGAVGWGGPGGYVYQKAYIEFFTSPSHLEKILKLIADFPTLTYTAVDVRGKSVSNIKFGEKGVNAVTWGVFPGREIIQPTVCDSNIFVTVWKDEAFALWKSQWQSIYPKGSPSWELIQEVHDTYYLVNIVDNDYVKGDIFALFDKLAV